MEVEDRERVDDEKENKIQLARMDSLQSPYPRSGMIFFIFFLTFRFLGVLGI